MTLIPFDAGGKGVVKSERCGELARFVDEIAASSLNVDLLQGDNVDLHRLQLRGEHVHWR